MHVNETGKAGNLISLQKLSEIMKPISTGKKHVHIVGDFRQLLHKSHVYSTKKLQLNLTEYINNFYKQKFCSGRDLFSFEM